MRALVLSMVVLFSSFSASAQKIKWYNGTFAQAKEKAQKENKSLFLDFLYHIVYNIPQDFA